MSRTVRRWSLRKEQDSESGTQFFKPRPLPIASLSCALLRAVPALVGRTPSHTGSFHEPLFPAVALLGVQLSLDPVGKDRTWAAEQRAGRKPRPRDIA